MGWNKLIRTGRSIMFGRRTHEAAYSETTYWSLEWDGVATVTENQGEYSYLVNRIWVTCSVWQLFRIALEETESISANLNGRIRFFTMVHGHCNWKPLQLAIVCSDTLRIRVICWMDLFADQITDAKYSGEDTEPWVMLTKASQPHGNTSGTYNCPCILNCAGTILLISIGMLGWIIPVTILKTLLKDKQVIGHPRRNVI